MKSKQKHFTIRRDLTSPIQTLKYLGQFIDKYDYGVDLGKKNIVHCNTSIRMNGLIFNKHVKPKDRNRYKLKSRHIYEHMSGSKTYYFTSSPFSRYRLCVPDIDNKTDDPTRITPFLNFFLSYFPDIFYDRGSSGKSLHPYLKLDMLPLYDTYFIDSDDDRTYPKYANELFNKAGYIIKLYGHYIIAPEHSSVDKETGELGTIYDVELDAIKGSYPDYDFFRNKKTKKYIITKVINHGVLVKLPRLTTEDDCLKFYSSSVYSILDFISFVVYIGSSLLLSFCLGEEEKNRVEQYLTELETVLMAHSVFPSQERKDSVALNRAEGDWDAQCPTLEREDNKNYVYMPGHFPVEIQKPHFQGKNKETLEGINNEPDVLKRSTRYLYFLYMKYALEGKELTDFEDYRINYRIEAGTGEETPANVKRLKYVWDNNIDRMKKYVYGGLKGRIDSLEVQVNQALTQETINKIRDDKSSFTRRIYPRDVASAALWIFVTLTNDKYLQMKNWTATHANNINQNKELTAPMVALEGFIEKLKDKEILKNGCDPKKAKALREILIYIGWIKCVDNSYDFMQAHRSMRYILTKKHPYYQEFEQIIGKDNIEYWEHLSQKKKNVVG